MAPDKKVSLASFILAIGVTLCSCAVQGAPSSLGSSVFSHLFPGEVAETGEWKKLGGTELPSFYQGMPKEYKELNPADAYFNKSFGAGLVVTYGKSLEFNDKPKMCLLETSAIYYLKGTSNQELILTGKTLYFAWEPATPTEGCNQTTPPAGGDPILIDGQLPVPLIKTALQKNKTFLNQCFGSKKIEKRSLTLQKVALPQSLNGPDAYLNFAGSGLNIVIELRLQNGDWQFGDCDEIFD